MQRTANKSSVIIIGAGLAGLTAADQILKQNPKAQVTVLQAMSEPGGRTKSISINGAVFDLGAQWIGHPQKYTIELAERSKNETIQQYHHGTNILQFGNKVQSYQTKIPMNVGYIPLIHMQMLMWKLDRLAKTVPLENPRDCPNAIYWDSMTAHSWIEQNVCFDKVRRLFQLSVRSVIGCETNEVSFLFLLWYIHHNHGFDCLVNVQNGLQNHKFVNGTQHMSKFLAEQITKKGGKIFYNSFVNKIIQNENEVTVLTNNGEKYSASYLIYAAPPPAARNICFEPPLSRQRRFICDRYIMGAYTKAILLYNKQYWREKGCSGAILSDCHNGPVLMTYDDTRPKQNGEIQPAIVVFMCASIDEQWTRDKQNCKKMIAQQLASYFKCPQMLNPSAVQIKVWNEQSSLGGAPTAFTPPGVLTKINNIRQPEGRIHWAGTETATISQGYMDGAIESGIRVSKQITKRFSNTQPQQFKKLTPPTTKWYSKISTFTRPYWFSRFLWW